MDREATTQEATDLLRGRWRLIYHTDDGKTELLPWQVHWECDGRKLTVEVEGGGMVKGTIRLVPSGRSYVFTCSLDPDNVVTRDRLEFRGSQIHLCSWGKSSVWQRQLIPANP
jgi:hypothetical protein